MKHIIDKCGGRKAFGFYALVILATVFYLFSNIHIGFRFSWMNLAFKGLDITFSKWSGLAWKLFLVYCGGNVLAKGSKAFGDKAAQKMKDNGD